MSRRLRWTAAENKNLSEGKMGILEMRTCHNQVLKFLRSDIALKRDVLLAAQLQSVAKINNDSWEKDEESQHRSVQQIYTPGNYVHYLKAGKWSMLTEA